MLAAVLLVVVPTSLAFAQTTATIRGRVLDGQGRPVHLGVVPTTSPREPLSDATVTERVLRWLDMVGLDPESAASLVVTPTCGLAGADPQWARRALRTCQQVSAALD